MMSNAPAKAKVIRAIGRRMNSGFTLIELVVVVAIIAILATIAFSSYRDQVIKSRRAAAASCLQERAQFLERHYTTYLSYGTPVPTISECDSEVRSYYLVSPVGTIGDKTFTLQAVPQGAQASGDTKCGTLTITAKGVRGESGTATNATECW